MWSREYRGRQRLERQPGEPVDQPGAAAFAHAGKPVPAAALAVDDRDRHAGGNRGRGDGGSGGAGARFRTRSVTAGQAEQRGRDGDDPDAGEFGAAKPLVQQQSREQDRHHYPGDLQGLRHRQRFQRQHQELEHQAAADQEEAGQPRGSAEQGARQSPEVMRLEGGQAVESPLFHDEAEVVDDRGRDGQDDPGMRDHAGLPVSSPSVAQYSAVKSAAASRPRSVCR